MSDTCEPTGFIPPALGEVSFIVMIVLIAVIAADICVAKLTKCPSFLLRIQANAAFLREYERRLDSVVSYDVLKAYRLGRKLGAGVTSEVFKVEERTSGTKFAMKKIPLKNSESLTKAVEEELEILGKLRHHHVVELHETFRSPTTVWVVRRRDARNSAARNSSARNSILTRRPLPLAQVLELVVGGELANYVMSAQTWNEAEAGRCMHQVLSGMAYLHSQGVVHRDLKPENLLLTRDAGANADNTTADDTVKICDFGLSVALGRNGTLSEKQGTWAYWAPEMFSPVGTYGKQVDMWSLGVILYIILSGRHPFDSPGRSDAQMRSCIQDAHVSFSHDAWAGVSSDAKELIQGLLRANPKQRLTAEELLVHPWIVGAQFGSVNTLPMPRSDERMGKFQRTTMKKFRRSLVGSIHRQATVRKRQSEKSDGVQVVGGGTAAAERRKEEALLLEDAFREFDPEGKGYVEEAQMAGVVARLGQSATPEEVRAMVTTIAIRRSPLSGLST